MRHLPAEMAFAGFSDEELLKGHAAGQRFALEELFRRYRLPAFRVAFRLLGNEADALDAVQDGFVRALTRLDGFQGRSSFRTWLLRVVSNSSLDLGRRRGIRQALSLDPLQDQNTREELTVHEEVGQRLEQEDLRRRLDLALNQLSEVQRQTFVLFADGELSYREIAEAMGTSVGTVMSRLFYARQKLRAVLDERALT
ncbi:MAG: RNA polymerase sigma factor [Gemmataceae bacterium]